jgi:hypothetical protein
MALNTAPFLVTGTNDPAKQVSVNYQNALVNAIAATVDGAAVDVAQHGILPSNTAAQNTAAWDALYAALVADAFAADATNPQLGGVRFGKGRYLFAEPIDINAGTIDIEGAGAGNQTILKFPLGSSGIIFQYYQSEGVSGGPVADHNHSSHSTLRNIQIQGSVSTAWSEGEYHGVVIRTHVYCQNVLVNAFEGDAWHIVAGALSFTNRGNANMFQLVNCTGRGSRNGIQIGDADANAYTIIGGSFDSNRRWGHYEPDQASLGGLILGAHYDGNGTVYGGAGAIYPNVSHNNNWYCCIDGEEAWAEVNAPSGTTADNQGWAYISAGGPTVDKPAWESGILIRSGGPVLSKSGNAASVFIGCYSEPGYGLPQVDLGNWIIGGGLATRRNIGNSGGLASVGGAISASTAFHALDGLQVFGLLRHTGASSIVYLNGTGGNSAVVFENNGATSGIIEQLGGHFYHTATEAKDHIFRYSGGTEVARFSTAALNLAAGKTLQVNSVQVVGAQGAAVADATDAGSAITQLNALLARCRAHGLIAT